MNKSDSGDTNTIGPGLFPWECDCDYHTILKTGSTFESFCAFEKHRWSARWQRTPDLQSNGAKKQRKLMCTRILWLTILLLLLASTNRTFPRFHGSFSWTLFLRAWINNFLPSFFHMTSRVVIASKISKFVDQSMRVNTSFLRVLASLHCEAGVRCLLILQQCFFDSIKPFKCSPSLENGMVVAFALSREQTASNGTTTI